MTVGELINVLRGLPPDAEVGVLTANAFARPPALERVTPSAWVAWKEPIRSCGFSNPGKAYLIRPEREVI